MRDKRRRQGVPLHDCHGNFLQFVGHDQGQAMVESGLAMEVRDLRYGRIRVSRYQETAGATASSSQACAPVITVSEMQANVLHSRTARLSEWDTRGRDSKYARELAKNPKRPPEDFVEQAQNKIREWKRVPLWNQKRVAWGTAVRA